MTKPNGLHHLAISTGDIKRQIAFFSDVLGMELVALYWMHGVQGAWHGFMKLNDRASIAFVQSPQIAAIKPQPGVSHAGNAGAPSAPGTMQHLALNVDNDADLLTLRDRIRSRYRPRARRSMRVPGSIPRSSGWPASVPTSSSATSRRRPTRARAAPYPSRPSIPTSRIWSTRRRLMKN